MGNGTVSAFYLTLFKLRAARVFLRRLGTQDDSQLMTLIEAKSECQQEWHFVLKELPFSQEVWLPTMRVCMCESRTSSPRHEKCNTNRKARSFCVLHRTVIELADIEMRWQVRRGASTFVSI